MTAISLSARIGTDPIGRGAHSSGWPWSSNESWCVITVAPPAVIHATPLPDAAGRHDMPCSASRPTPGGWGLARVDRSPTIANLLGLLGQNQSDAELYTRRSILRFGWGFERSYPFDLCRRLPASDYSAMHRIFGFLGRGLRNP
jgi:hypothetical protein